MPEAVADLGQVGQPADLFRLGPRRAKPEAGGEEGGEEEGGEAPPPYAA